MKFFALQRYLLLAVILSLALLAEMFWVHALTPLENRLSDALLARHALNSKPDSNIVIVDIDERSLALLADSVGRWPWPRSLHAELVEGIERQQPKAIVFDILFSDPDLIRATEDQYFADVIRAHDNLYFPMLLLDSSNPAQGIPLKDYGAMLGIGAEPGANPQAKVSMVLPLPAMLESKRVGTHNVVADKDGVVRNYPIYTNTDGWHIPSLPAKVAAGIGYALPKDASIRLNWHGHALSYARVSYADVYNDLQRKVSQRPANEFANKIVIIGATANGLHDIRATPIAGFYPGVEILATTIDNLKNADPLKQAPSWVLCLFGLVLLSALAWAFLRYCYLVRIGTVLVLITISSLILAYFALRWHFVVWVLTPLVFAWAYYLVAGLMEYWTERKTRERAVATFSRFLDPRVVQALVARGETTQSLSGKSRDITVLFSDIRGFTTLSEKSTPEQVVELLNAYFTVQSGAVFTHEGTLDKYIGDAIMAFWGAPAEQPDHALKAVAAAMEMSDCLERFRLHANGLGTDLEIGIGVHSGSAVVGFIGSDNKQDYTAIGDTVNLASRIEGQTKGIARVLVSEDTKLLCQEQAGTHGCPYEFRDCGSYEVKGRAQPVRLFEPKRI